MKASVRTRLLAVGLALVCGILLGVVIGVLTDSDDGSTSIAQPVEENGLDVGPVPVDPVPQSPESPPMVDAARDGEAHAPPSVEDDYPTPPTAELDGEYAPEYSPVDEPTDPDDGKLP